MRIQHFIIACILLLLPACGKRGPVRPLNLPVPAKVKAAQIRQQGDALLLSWQLPTQNLDGSPISQAPVLDIYRMLYDPQNECPDCFDRSALLVHIDPEYPAPAQQTETGFRFLDAQIAAGQGYKYTLIVKDRSMQPGQPLILKQVASTPLSAPQQLTGVARDRSVSLSWQPAPLHAGDTLLGYQIYRRQTKQQERAQVVNSRPVTATHYDDFNLVNGQSYSYQVRALVKRDAGLIEGHSSSAIEIIPTRDNSPKN